MSENSTTEALNCFNCHKPLSLQPGAKVLKNEECPYCYADVHCCKMCQFYDSTAYNECREPSAERIVEKEKSNFCDFFVLKGAGGAGQTKDDLLSAADALFKK